MFSVLVLLLILQLRPGDDGYAVGDSVVFDESDANGGGLSAEVQKIYGKDVNKVTSETT